MGHPSAFATDFLRVPRAQPDTCRVTPQAWPARKHPPDVVQGGVSTPECEDPLYLIGSPEGVEHLVHSLRSEARLPIEQGVVAVLIRVLVETDHSEDVLVVVGIRHR